MAENLCGYDGLELRVKGDGRRYKLIIRTSRDWDTVGYTIGFDTVKDQWQSVSQLILILIHFVFYEKYTKPFTILSI